MAKHPGGRPRVDLGPAAVAFLRNDLHMSWRQIARGLKTPVSTVRTVYGRSRTDSPGESASD